MMSVLDSMNSQSFRFLFLNHRFKQLVLDVEEIRIIQVDLESSVGINRHRFFSFRRLLLRSLTSRYSFDYLLLQTRSKPSGKKVGQIGQ